ncbi:MAG: hypothetical protein UT56_C0024G0001, partial [Candidatus Levybacteria bacterium GW2011_GWB1_39_7]
MLSTDECREHLADIPLTDAQVERLRDALYALVENVLDDYIKKADTVEPCKKQLSTAEYPLSDKRQKGT